jgi:hypothetical protein
MAELGTAERPRFERRQVLLLEKKNAVVYGAGGAVGCAVARAFAREGAVSCGSVLD